VFSVHPLDVRPATDSAASALKPKSRGRGTTEKNEKKLLREAMGPPRLVDRDDQRWVIVSNLPSQGENSARCLHNLLLLLEKYVLRGPAVSSRVTGREGGQGVVLDAV